MLRFGFPEPSRVAQDESEVVPAGQGAKSAPPPATTPSGQLLMITLAPHKLRSYTHTPLCQRERKFSIATLDGQLVMR